MELLLELANKFGFERVCSKLDKPIVFHCVPGAGKTSLIRELITGDRRFKAYTAGLPEESQLSGCWIRSVEECKENSEFCILDEYTLFSGDIGNFFAVFGDPCQSAQYTILRAHFTSTKSKRFGKETAKLLRELGFTIDADGEDKVEILDIFKEEPRGTVVYVEEEVGCLLRQHGVTAYTSKEITGQTFEEVTFVTGEQFILQGKRNETFQCLTRHRKRLIILNPYAAYAAP